MPSLYSSPLPSLILPDRVAVDLRGAYRALDELAQNKELPTIDTEALMSRIVELLSIYGGERLGRVAPAPRGLSNLLFELDLITEDYFRVDGVADAESEHHLIRRSVFNAFKHADAQLERRGIYVGKYLPYHYVQRVNHRFALLRLQKATHG